jgi:hypothetical protein
VQVCGQRVEPAVVVNALEPRHTTLADAHPLRQLDLGEPPQLPRLLHAVRHTDPELLLGEQQSDLGVVANEAPEMVDGVARAHGTGIDIA